MLLRRVSVPLTALALIAGSWLTAASASAATAHVSHASAPAADRPGTFVPGGRMIGAPGAAHPDAHGVVNQAESTNWSGYAATGSNGAFNKVSASWTEPTATCSSRRSAQYAAFWVGLDGFSSNSVEQTGTDSDCSGRTPVYYGWYEMYPAFPVNFSNAVRPGDHISASVTFSGTSTYTLVLSDSTQGWTQTITQNESGLARSSAEVITEAPSSSSGVLPLANFGTISYSSATANGTALASLSPTEIIMIDNSGAEKDSTSGISGGSFSNTWIRSN
jgi:Peptidase A4 family